ncbi:MAG: type I polyketide synthase, partial [Proteobacteria bacterium]|nr:type I polyketide synthase [Pseudomonadota bacterium]
MTDLHTEAEAIAIIGMDGRFPGARDIREYWENLVEGRETIDRFEPEEIDRSVPGELARSNDYVRARGRMPEADRFDAAFFGISPREAEVLDPQQRVFLEMCWRALEHAGYAAGTHDALTGVFGGMSNNTYFKAHVAANPEVLSRFGDMSAMIANEKDYLTTRVAYKLDLRGPCINVTTACSTSLVAICHAVNSLLDYHCDLALAGGVAVSCPQERGYLYQEGSIYSPDGHCRPFDASAGGTVFSNGGGVVVLKRLSDAMADGDFIHAVIRGAALNNDGAGKVSFTAPGVDGQAQVIAMAQEMAGVDPASISYIEAHGTGTTLGDPIELAALTQAFRRHTQAAGFCGIGSVKGNIGHLDAASGVAGLIKTVLALCERKIPATLHFDKPNPKLGLEGSPFHVVDTLRDWTSADAPRRAAVSSFGLGGTNAHVLLEEAPLADVSPRSDKRQLLVLSAKTPSALERAREALAEHLRRHEDIDLADAAWTLQAGRQPFTHRLSLDAVDAREAAELLAANDAGRIRRGSVPAQPPACVFMFPGQGSQRLGMAQRLYDEEPLVRDIIDRCSIALANVLDFDLRDVMFDRIDNAGELLDETQYTQPALFAVEYALGCLWRQWGLRPAVMLGHSIGEFSAAALAGVFELEDAVRVVATRARLMQEQHEGSMLSVRLPAEELRQRLVPGTTIAGVNAPGLCVASGDDDAIARLQHRLEAEQVQCSLLRTSHAFHSHMMDAVVDRFETYLADVPMSPPSTPVISTVTGEAMTAAEATNPAYWSRQLREPVCFMKALQTARACCAPASPSPLPKLATTGQRHAVPAWLSVYSSPPSWRVAMMRPGPPMPRRIGT